MSVEQGVRAVFDEWLAPYDFAFRVDKESSHDTPFTVTCKYVLGVDQTHDRVAGQQRPNCSSRDECMLELAQYVNDVESGQSRRVVSIAEDRIATDPLGSFEGIQRIDSIERSYVERCTDCKGSGSVSCGSCAGRGNTQCIQCSYGKRSCTACGGAGSTYVGSERKSCMSCAGSGRVTCYNCGGTGSVRCGQCGGTGTRPCSSCGATGYFTHQHRAFTRIKTEQNFRWSGSSAPGWLKTYIRAACRNQVPQADINAVMRWDKDSFRPDQDVFPLTATIEGMLHSGSGEVRINGGEPVEVQLVGDSYVPYDLNCIMDEVVQENVKHVESDRNLGDISKFLGCQLVRHNIANYQETGRPDNLISSANLLSEDGCNRIRQCFVRVGEYFRSLRSYISVPRLLAWLGVFTAMGLILVSYLRTLMSEQAVAQFDLLNIVLTLPALIGTFWYRLLEEPLVFFGGLYLLFIPSIVAMFFLGKVKRPSSIRMIGWFVAGGFIISIFAFPVAQLTSGVGLVPPEPSKMLDHFSLSSFFSALPELLLVTFPLAVLRTRHVSYGYNRRLVNRANSPELNQYLDYE